MPGPLLMQLDVLGVASPKRKSTADPNLRCHPP